MTISFEGLPDMFNLKTPPAPKMKPTTQLIQELRDEAKFRPVFWGGEVPLLNEAADRLEKLLGMVPKGANYSFEGFPKEADRIRHFERDGEVYAQPYYGHTKIGEPIKGTKTEIVV